MSEDRPTISSSRLSSTDVARHSFGNVRRGFDPHEVRSFLDSVARELQLAEQREQELRAQLADAEDRARHPILDEATISSNLGQQSANVIRAAHDEAARIVTAAEEAAATMAHHAQRQASDIQVAAEAAAAERIADAELSASAIRHQIEREGAELVDAARAEGDEVLAHAREQGRALVERAQLARREVLADLAHRRRDLHMQIEQLRAARDELAAIVRGVRGSVDGIVADLVRADDDARAAAAEVARRPLPELGAIEEELEEGLVGGIRIDRLADLGPEPTATRGAPGEFEAARAGWSEIEVDLAEQLEEAGELPQSAVYDAALEATVVDARGGSRTDTAAGVPAEVPGEVGPGEVGPGDRTGSALAGIGALTSDLASAEARENQSVEELFARIRAVHDGEQAGAPTTLTQPSSEATDAGGSPSPPAVVGRTPAEADLGEEKAETPVAHEPPEGAAGAASTVELPGVDATGAADEQGKGTGDGSGAGEGDGDGDDALDPIVGQRADLLDPVIARLTRRLKRALQDDQNRLLDMIRSGSGQWNDDVQVAEEEQRAQLVEASSRLLQEAYTAGTTFARQQLQPGAKAPRASRAADQRAAAAAAASAKELSDTVVSQLRRRLSGGEGDTDGVDDIGERVGAAYREWRGERIERLVGDVAVGAFSSGVLAGTGSGGLVRWLPTNGEATCPDCDDNSLAGLIAPGTEFPTGHAHPPAHPGCRCLVAPSVG